MDSYIVRIYRRNSSSSQNLVGLVELVEIDEEKVFTSFEELREILNSRQGHGAGKDKKKCGEKPVGLPEKGRKGEII